LSLFLYSALGLLIFASLYIYDEKTPKVRWYMYVQGWLFLLIAAAAYEWFDSALDQAASIVVNKLLVVENPYTWIAKRYSIILFGAIFLFWLLEVRKRKFKNDREIRFH
jgi:chromate transport protein ChrA